MPAIINPPNTLHSKSHKIDYVKLITTTTEYDITDQLLEFVLFEDILDDAINGDIVFVDSNNILSGAPVIGREKLEISFSSRDDNDAFFLPYKKTFKIINTNGLQKDIQNNTEVYTMSIISEAYSESDKIKISKSFNNTPDKIVSSLMSIINTPISVEECLYKRKFIVPNISPFQFIKFLCDESTSKVNQSSDFVFFENKDGFNFKSAYTLMQAQTPTLITYRINTKGNPDHRFNARHILIDKYFNSLEHYNGICGATIITHDIKKKKQLVNKTDYYSYTKDFKNMNNGNLFIDNNQQQLPNSRILYDIADTIYSEHNSLQINQRLKRLINRALLNNSKITISLSGNIDLKTGDVILLDYRDEFNKPDLIRSGKYIITKIKHDVTKVEYMMTLECSKDSFITTSKKL